MKSVERLYESIGGNFLTPQTDIASKLKGIKAFVFDWDGVFNNGLKQANGSSSFNEIDSMGTNLLRFSYFLLHQTLPLTAIISGEKNDTAFFFSNREHFHSSYFKIADKRIGINHFCEQHKLKTSEIAYFFDDVLDLPLAEAVGLRVCIQRKASTAFTEFVKSEGLADYITGAESGDYAVREACEMLMLSSGNFSTVLKERMQYSSHYRDYIQQRNATPTQFFTLSNGQIAQTEL